MQSQVVYISSIIIGQPLMTERKDKPCICGGQCEVITQLYFADLWSLLTFVGAIANNRPGFARTCLSIGK